MIWYIYHNENVTNLILIEYRLILSRVYGFVTKNNGFWIGWLDLMILLLQSLQTTIIYSAITNLLTSQITRTR
jgi:hypothetical protein